MQVQVQDRIGMSTTGLPLSIPPLDSNINHSGNHSGNSKKETISPNPTNSPTKSAGNHNRSISSNSMPQEYLNSLIPLVRSQTEPYASLHLEQSRSDGNSIGNTSDWNQTQSPYSSPSRQHPPPELPSDSDSQEQSLFEERLCEDIYGVAVRKINHNGKSNLRYVKCLYVDAPEVLHNDEPTPNTPQHYSSNRSVSSRHSRSSRVSLPRFLGGGSSHHRTSLNINNASSSDNDAHRSLLQEIETNNTASNTTITPNRNRNGKVRILSWGKKKEVTVPVDMFTAVRKGKVNDRTRRNPSDSSRILSLVTSDIHSTNEKRNSNCVSLDIETPTRLDRDKFAKAFARFLNVPLVEEDDIIRASTQPSAQQYVSTAFPQQQYNHKPVSPQRTGGADGNRSIARSIKSETTAQSWKEDHRQSIASSVNNDNSIPDIALTASNSLATSEKGNGRSSSWKQINNAPLPVVTTRGISSPATMIKNIATKPPRNNRRSISGSSAGVAVAPPMHPGITGTININNGTNGNGNSKTFINHNTNINGSSSRTGSDIDDPPLVSLPSSSSRGASNTNNSGLNSITVNNLNTITASSATNRKMVLEIPFTTKSRLAKSNNNSNSIHDRSTPATLAISGHVHSHSRAPNNTPIANDNPNAASDSNSINIDNSDINNISRATLSSDLDEMDGSVVSSITGVGFDQDLVEELHLALERMKVELEESRAEASRAVKVAEQAIQSAENSSSKDWNNTVTHKAAEAAATAQKKSAEAMAKARVAEERLQLERKASALRKKQVDEAEQQASHWQTRAAAAEVQRFAVAEALESERKKNLDLVSEAEKAVSNSGSSPQRKNQGFNPIGKRKLASTTSKSDAEVDRLRSKLAMESARRRKLLDELQDLRGAIRVYCRLRAPTSTVITVPKKQPAVVDMISNEVLRLNRNRSSGSQHQQQKALGGGNNGAVSSSSFSKSTTPLCFEFDGILSSDMGQQEVYAEFEAICASVVEGFNICVMSYGQANSGKTHTMLGDVVVVNNNNGNDNGNADTNSNSNNNRSVLIENEGIHLRASKQLFSLLEHRKDRFEGTVTMNLVEVHDEKLIDLLVGTDFGEKHGNVEHRKSSSRKSDTKSAQPSSSEQQLKPKLEIKTNRDGETVVRGVLSVDLASYEDVLTVWTESLSMRSKRLAEQNVENSFAYEKESHVVATIKVTSKNLATGSIAFGKMQFVDFASSDITMKRPLGSSGTGVSSFLSQSLSTKLLSSGVSSEQLLEDWKFTNKSLNTVREVVLSRSQYQRSVPYRNSTITHILSDSLEADTKVVLIACVSSNEEDVQNTACTLQLAQEMRKVVVGKATRHTTIGSSSSSDHHNQIS